jgi:hypothetical protein
VSAGDADLGLDLLKGLPGADVLALEELAGEEGECAVLPFLPGGWRGGRCPFAGGAGSLLEREADVADGGAQLCGGRAGRDAVGDDEPGDGVQVDVAGVAAGQGYDHEAAMPRLWPL